MSRSFTHVLTIGLTAAQHAEITRIADERRVAMSEVVREAIDHQISPHKGGRGFSALTAEQVERMRARRAAGEPYRSIAADFGVAPATVLYRLRRSPAEAARDVATVETAPPSAPVAASRVASAGESKHPWRRQGAALAKRPAAMRSRS